MKEQKLWLIWSKPFIFPNLSEIFTKDTFLFFIEDTIVAMNLDKFHLRNRRKV